MTTTWQAKPELLQASLIEATDIVVAVPTGVGTQIACLPCLGGNNRQYREQGQTAGELEKLTPFHGNTSLHKKSCNCICSITIQTVEAKGQTHRLGQPGGDQAFKGTTVIKQLLQSVVVLRAFFYFIERYPYPFHAI